MDKEKIITVVIGLLVGIGVAGGYFAIVKFLPRLSSNTPKVTYTPPPGAPTAAQTLTVTSPDDNATTLDSPTTVKGQASPGTQIVLYAPADEKVASADASGNFSVDIKLEDGQNEITVTTLSDTGVAETIKRNIILEIKL